MTLGQVAYDRWRALHTGPFAHPLVEWALLGKGTKTTWEQVALAVLVSEEQKKARSGIVSEGMEAWMRERWDNDFCAAVAAIIAIRVPDNGDSIDDRTIVMSVDEGACVADEMQQYRAKREERLEKALRALKEKKQ